MNVLIVGWVLLFKMVLMNVFFVWWGFILKMVNVLVVILV